MNSNHNGTGFYVACLKKPWWVVVVLALFSLLFCLGFDIAFLRLNRAVHKAEIIAKQEIAEAEKELASAEKDAANKLIWFHSSCREDVLRALKEGRLALTDTVHNEGAKELYVKAGVTSRKHLRLELFRETIRLSFVAKESGRKINALIGTLTKERGEAFAFMQQATAEFDRKKKSFDATKDISAKEEKLYLSKYGNLLRSLANDGTSLAEEAKRYLKEADRLLPAGNSKGQGNPNKAKIAIKKAISALEKIAETEKQLISQRDLLRKAHAEADEAFVLASQTNKTAEKLISDLKRQTGLWLKQASLKLAAAEAETLASSNFLFTKAEGDLTDRPAAYEAAKRALALSEEAEKLASDEVQLANDVKKQISLLNEKLKSLPTLQNNAEKLLSSLRLNHAEECWTEFRNKGAECAEFNRRANLFKEEASKCAANDRQEFFAAQEKAKQGLSAIEAARESFQSLRNSVQRMDGAKTDYAQKSARAQQTIEAEEYDVSRYGSYYESARSEWARAVSELEQSKIAANQKRFEAACELADLANNRASGTGDSCKSAYDRKKREEADALAAAAAAAARLNAETAGENDSGSRSSWGGTDWNSNSSSESGSPYDYSSSDNNSSSDNSWSDNGGSFSDNSWGNSGSDNSW